ncbi:hypothetical protein Nepgr_006202 [Nepenthes gracilis]|uniref:Transcription factor MYB1 n=1 Tax=Nepenthes gracilis TaxID=150966 RepID=A0AAD3XH62_NEPGR|nr:hypothetical protein Nepgr_006202 [Nepenthes gracilis]
MFTQPLKPNVESSLTPLGRECIIDQSAPCANAIQKWLPRLKIASPLPLCHSVSGILHAHTYSELKNKSIACSMPINKMGGGRVGVRKGLWTKEEDLLLRQCIEKYGEGNWHQVPLQAGLNRCRKSCRLRWLNYLRPNIKRGQFMPDEVDLIIRLHKLLGNRWTLIAGRLPGRTGNDIKNYWNTHLSKKFSSSQKISDTGAYVGRANIATPRTVIIKPQPRSFAKTSPWLTKRDTKPNEKPTWVATVAETSGGCDSWWESLLEDMEENNGYNYNYELGLGSKPNESMDVECSKLKDVASFEDVLLDSNDFFSDLNLYNDYMN